MTNNVVYALLIGIRSSRKIKGLLGDSLVFMYLSGKQIPDFRTICRFKRNHMKDIERCTRAEFCTISEIIMVI
jgi:transposase